MLNFPNAATLRTNSCILVRMKRSDMKQALVYFCGGLLLTACGKGPAGKTPETPAAENRNGMYCYRSTANKDTVVLSFERKKDRISGQLSYHLFEKDANTGTITGTVSGDTIFADYRYLSEGVTSTREVIFLASENTLTEGYGEMEERDAKFVFSDRRNVLFKEGIQLTKEPCH